MRNGPERDDIAAFQSPSWEEFQRKPVFRHEIKDRTYPSRKNWRAGVTLLRGQSLARIEFYSNG